MTSKNICEGCNEPLKRGWEIGPLEGHYKLSNNNYIHRECLCKLPTEKQLKHSGIIEGEDCLFCACKLKEWESQTCQLYCTVCLDWYNGNCGICRKSLDFGKKYKLGIDKLNRHVGQTFPVCRDCVLDVHEEHPNVYVFDTDGTSCEECGMPFFCHFVRNSLIDTVCRKCTVKLLNEENS